MIDPNYDEAWGEIEMARKNLFASFRIASREAKHLRCEEILKQMTILSSVALVVSHWADDEYKKTQTSPNQTEKENQNEKVS